MMPPNEAVWPMVIRDAERLGAPQSVLERMAARDMLGRHRYGVPLTVWGEGGAPYAVEEADDLCAYLLQAAMRTGDAAMWDAYNAALHFNLKLSGLVK